ncbi:MAG: DUF2088 domain-containing protein, partial [Candidatus Helarchaeota archaeon]
MKNLSLIKIHQKFDSEKLDNIPEIISKEFGRIHLDRKIKPGMEIGITVGSRGIDNLPLIIKSIINEIKKRKGIPFILTA